MAVRALILTGFGINCDHETATAFRKAGADADRIHLNALIDDPVILDAYHIFAAPGGFSFGDDIASGKILANRLRYRLGDALKAFVAGGKLVIGICNGFQVLVKMGLLPLLDGAVEQTTTLTHNDSGRFEDRWVHLTIPNGAKCVWVKGLDRIELPIRHGEGRFVARDEEVLRRMWTQGQVALQYARRDGALANGAFPDNPNGSVDDIAGICDPSGRVFGLMPHPEAFLEAVNHPTWTREESLPAEGQGVAMFRNAVNHVRAAIKGE